MLEKKSDRMLIQTASAVLDAHTAVWTRVQALSASSPTQCAAVYTPLAQALAGYVQHLPSAQHPDQSILSVRLQQAACVLRRRSGRFLPPGVSPERSARESDLWTYVAYSVALLRGLAHELSPWTITLWSSDDTACGLWQPWLAPRGLTTVNAAAYRVQPNPAAPNADWTPLIIGALMPEAGLNWLWREPTVWQVWQQALIAAELPDRLQPLFVNP